MWDNFVLMLSINLIDTCMEIEVMNLFQNKASKHLLLLIITKDPLCVGCQTF